MSFVTIGFLKMLDVNLKNIFGYHDLLMMAYSLKNIAILSAKGVEYKYGYCKYY